MKRVKGGKKVIRGQIDTGTYNGNENRIQLFDGKFTTGYKIVMFEIISNAPATGHEIVAKLSTKPKSNIAAFDFSDVEEVGWAGSNIPTNTRYSEFNLVDDENMIIEDLYISGYTTAEATVMNYYIVLEKYEFTAWDGAATMVRNQSQSGS
tara:strand:+ start:1392 stop:1844 length:453 start_codon:yes stop_codon:yes gene_type:complete